MEHTSCCLLSLGTALVPFIRLQCITDRWGRRNPRGLYSTLLLGTGSEALCKTAISQATTHKECFVKLERARELPLELMDAVQPL